MSALRKIALEILLIVVPVASFFCFWNLGQGSFGLGDETIHACVVQEMVRTGHFIHPTLGERVYYNKPPLKMWLSAAIVSVFGQTNFNYRVLDGLSGLLIVVIVFCFSYLLYQQRLVSYLSILLLLGSQLFYFRHGVRYAVQDGPSLLCLTVAIVAAWYFLFSDSQLSARIRTRAGIVGSLAIGFGSMCKGLATFMAYPIILIGLLFSNQIGSVIIKKWRSLVLIVLGSCLPLALFIVAQGSKAGFCLKTLLWGEGVKRAVEGYQNIDRPLYYFYLVFNHNLTLPAAIIVASVAFAVYQLIKSRDPRTALILSWALVPLILHSVMRSRLPWYIMPALPGLSILGGVFLGSLAQSAIMDLSRFNRQRTAKRFGTILEVGALTIGLTLSLYNLVLVMSRITTSATRTVHNLALDDIKKYQRKTGKILKVAFHDNYPLTRNEYFYWQMLTAASPTRGKILDLNNALNNNLFQILITHPRRLREIFAIREPESYLLTEVKGKKPSQALILNYEKGVVPYGFTSNKQVIEFGASSTRLLYGWGEKVGLPNMTARESLGLRSAMLFPVNGVEKNTGLKATIRLGLLQDATDLQVRVLVNDEPIAVLSDLRTKPSAYAFNIPPELLVIGNNLLRFEYINQRDFNPTKPGILFGRMALALLKEGSSVSTGDAI